MLEIFLLIGAVSAIAAFARSRGGSAWIWGTTAIGGYLLAIFLAAAMIRGAAGEPNPLLADMIGWGWMGLVALYTRFGLGAGRPKPGGMWSCPNCTYLNAHYAVQCEACGQAYALKGEKATTDTAK